MLRQFLRKGQIEHRALSRLGVEAPRVSESEIERIEALAELGQLRMELKERSVTSTVTNGKRLDLRVIRELSYSEIAECLSVSEATVRARVSRGLRKLGEQLDGLRAEEGRA